MKKLGKLFSRIETWSLAVDLSMYLLTFLFFMGIFFALIGKDFLSDDIKGFIMGIYTTMGITLFSLIYIGLMELYQGKLTKQSEKNALEFLKNKGMINDDCTKFEITGDFGKVNLGDLLNEFKNQN